LKILIPETLAHHFDSNIVINRLKDEACLDSVEFSKLYILSISSPKLANKLHALTLVIFKQVLEDFNKQDPNQQIEVLTITMLVPEPSIPVILGKGGSNLQKIQEKSFTEIKIQEKSNFIMYRKVEISGRTLDIETAVKQILLATKHFPTPPVKTSEDFNSKIKFILKTSLQRKLITEDFVVEFENKFGVQVKWKSCSKQMKVTLEGSHLNCKDAVNDFVVLVALSDPENSNRIFLTIPSTSIVKIIGPKGKLIRDISSNSGGAKITILADKNMAKEQKNSEAVVEGNSETKLAAVINLFELLNNIRKERQFPMMGCDEVYTLGAVVPDVLVSKLIGKGGITVKNMMDGSDCSIAFLEPDKKLYTAENERGRMVSLKGNTKSISTAMKLLLNNIEKFKREENNAENKTFKKS
jgi:hypothetical protein